MSWRKKILLALPAALLPALLALAAWQLPQFERHEKEIQYPSPEVLLNPYLAAEHFLKAQGIKLRRTRRLDQATRLPASDKTLLLLASRASMDEAQTQDLLQWTAQGGHLVLVARQAWDAQKNASGDLLLDRLGIHTLERPRVRLGAGQKPVDHKTRLYLQDEKSPAYIGFSARRILQDTQNRAHVWAGNEEGTKILQLYYGDGLITVTSEAAIWSNDLIVFFDHAWLLWYLCQEDSDVTLLYALAPQQVGLFGALLAYFPEALSALLLLVLLALWRSAQRHGSLLADAPRARRQLQEHLRASGDFLLRRLGRAALVQRLQEDIERRASVLYSDFAAQPQATRWQRLAQLCRQDPAQVAKAMQAPGKRLGAGEFIQQAARLQRLRNAL